MEKVQAEEVRTKIDSTSTAKLVLVAYPDSRVVLQSGDGNLCGMRALATAFVMAGLNPPAALLPGMAVSLTALGW